MKKLLLFSVVVLVLSSCSGFQPVSLDHDEDKEQLDYRDGGWLPKNS